MIKVTGRVTNASAVKAKLDSVRAAIPDALSRERLGDFLLKRMQERFRKQVDPQGIPWAPLSPKTKAGRGILFKTGNLYRAMRVLDGNVNGRFGSATGGGFRIGIDSRRYSEVFKNTSRSVDTAVYGQYHQRGIGVPRRRFIGLSALDRRAVSDLVRRELSKAVKGAA